MLFLTVLLISVQAGIQPVPSGQQYTIGVVWTPPESSILATAELEQIRASGITKIRTSAILDQVILDVADSLNLVLFRELPFSRFTARELADTTAFATKLLSALVSAGRGHSSAGPIGLAVQSDVSDPAACSFFSDVRSGQSVETEQAFYYVGSFIEDDACSDSVDFVLLDALDEPDPLSVLARWSTAHETQAGLSAVGWWVDIDAGRGLGIERSVEEQARALETAIGAIASSGISTPIFVHRWRDQTRRSGGENAVWDMYGRHYGLHDADRQPRPAMHVLTGFLTTGQDVFAFDSADSRPFSFPWFILLGWLLLVAVSVLYASSPRFRYMLPRYFVAHGFFRNAVREAREVLPIVSTALLTVMGIAVGQIGTQVFLVLHDSASVRHLVDMLPYQAQSIVIAMLEGPLLSVILLGSLALLGMAGWMGLWMIVASRKAPLLPSQALMLGVWPRWQLLVLLPMVMSIHTLSPESALIWIGVLIPLWIGTAFWATVRTAYDLYKITRCQIAAAVIVWFFNPVWLAFLTFLVLSLVYADQAVFFWHVVTRS